MKWYIICFKIFLKDFEGQKKAEKTYKYILGFFLIISTLVSAFFQKMSYGVYGMMGGLVVAMIVKFNKNKIFRLLFLLGDVIINLS
jgi:ascorbate-specific PTS system EIIC-type component UlaA